jgi:hypothetical protein
MKADTLWAMTISIALTRFPDAAVPATLSYYYPCAVETG